MEVFEYPPILTGSVEEQLAQLRDYLVRLTQKLNEFFAAAYADGTMLEMAKLYGVQESVIAQ